jgi:hypothetical protein
MEIIKTTSPKWRLDAQDFLKGAIVAIGAAVSIPVQAWADSWATSNPVTLNPKVIAMTGVGAFVTYLVKNLITPAQTIIKPTSTGTNAGQ